MVSDSWHAVSDSRQAVSDSGQAVSESWQAGLDSCLAGLDSCQAVSGRVTRLFQIVGKLSQTVGRLFQTAVTFSIFLFPYSSNDIEQQSFRCMSDCPPPLSPCCVADQHPRPLLTKAATLIRRNVPQAP